MLDVVIKLKEPAGLGLLEVVQEEEREEERAQMIHSHIQLISIFGFPGHIRSHSCIIDQNVQVRELTSDET